MLLFQELDNNMNVVWASPTDVCTLCRKEFLEANSGMSRDDMNPVIATEKLRGKLYGKRIFKYGHNEFTLCEEHVDKIHKLLKLEDA